MKKIILFLNKYRPDLMVIFFLSLLVYKAWATLLPLTIRSDGFASMLSSAQKTFWQGSFPLASFMLSEMILDSILPKIFGVHLSLYYWFVVFTIIAIGIMFYLTMKIITKNRLVAFSAAIIFSVSYFGVYDMVSTHCYCLFANRVYPVLFLIPSFLFLHLFLERNKGKYFIVSTLLYFLAVGLGHFVLLIFPAFFLYPLFWKLFNEKIIRKKIEGFIYGLFYVLLTGFFYGIQQINESVLSPHKWTFMQFLLHPEKYSYLKKIALQYVYWSQYPLFFHELPINPMYYIVDFRVAPSYIPFTILIYVIAALVVYKLLPKQRPMLFTLVFSISIIFYFNAYIGQYDMLNFSGASRYLYLPSILLSIFWAYFLWAVFWRKKTILVGGGIFLLAVYFVINVRLISSNNIMAIEWDRSARTIFDYVISSRPKLSSQTLVVVTYPEFGSQEATFFTEQIGKGGVQYISDNILVNAPDHTWEKVASSSSHVIKLSYDNDCRCVKDEKLK